MLKDAAASSVTTREMLDYSKVILKYDILDICTNGNLLRKVAFCLWVLNFQGPQEILNKTEICQPALYLSGLAAVVKSQQNPHKWLVPSISTFYLSLAHLFFSFPSNAVAGLSLGEYTALVHAKALSFEDGLKVLHIFLSLLFLCLFTVKHMFS